ncbi:hypothetical protein [Yinghuangia soli]|uniref:Uncharacterized protein n=1 Tax=Yinghuangia soli TaxID=2908204 RepID=A0AA41TZ98_9ACTN|nr:hypothetical protein [Yinghuangia soli]MCF2528613.1 hypothetical protein [Yinghuangia soli]
MRTMSEEEIAADARPLVDFVGEVLGPGREPVWRGMVGAPCTRPDGTSDPDVRAYTAGAQVMGVPVREHIGLLTRLHDRVAELHWDVTYFAAHQDTGTAALVCVDPRTGFELAVNSTKPPTAFAVLVNTPPTAVPAPEPVYTPEPAPAPEPKPGPEPGGDIRDILG